MISYCGLDCTKCEGFLAAQTNNEEELKKVAEKWSEIYHADIKPEHVICDGCKAEKRKSFHCANTCNIRKCCIDKNLTYCINCQEFPCEDIQFILNNAPEAAENLKNTLK